MRLPRIARTIRRITVLSAASALLLGVPAAAAAHASSAATGTGWIRLAHLSPNTPAVDVYLYSFGDSSAQIVLHHVAYGTVSPYEVVAAGDYSVAMRVAGASATSQPVLSTSVTIAADHAYTVAGMGPESGLRLQVMDDDLTTPAGKALVRVIQASLKQQTVKVTWDGNTIAPKLSFASLTSYQAITPGTQTVTAIGGSETATQSVTFAAGTVHTLVVLDGADGLELVNLEDAAGAGQPPLGGTGTGFGGTAPHGPGSPLPWAALIGAGSLLALTGGLRLRRTGRGRRLPAGS
ncbi:MAG TPA: DUF4397 domain-containing protein [Streptosporangiaceae bacterium]|jgi:hypothetical protein|nr:DUF4397 domain-containing protein [Streptosporangiaceae bacterium]